jgi:hypothetical protein
VLIAAVYISYTDIIFLAKFVGEIVDYSRSKIVRQFRRLSTVHRILIIRENGFTGPRLPPNVSTWQRGTY